MSDPRFPRVALLNNREPYAPAQSMPNLPTHTPAQLPRTNQGSGAPSAGLLQVPSAQAIRDPHHYAFLADLIAAVGVVSALVLEQPPSRRNFLMLRNNSGIGGANLFISFGTSATLGATLVLAPATAANPGGQIVLFDTVVPQNDIYAIADAAGGSLSYAYGNLNE